jgi:hypothetical protein
MARTKQSARKRSDIVNNDRVEAERLKVSAHIQQGLLDMAESPNESSPTYEKAKMQVNSLLRKLAILISELQLLNFVVAC